MLQPKRTKYRKMHKMKIRGKATRGAQLSFGSFGIKAIEECWMTGKQIEAARVAMTRFLKREGQVWIRVFPDRPITSKPAEVPMGGGKGDLQGYSIEVLPGRVLFEVDGVTEAVAREALRKAGTKLPVKTRIIARD